MPHTIHLAAELPAPPARIYDAYLDRKTHAAITGAPATVSARAGAKFSAFGGTLSGTILKLVPKSLIVQSWRASHWKKQDLDSILILTLKPYGRGKTLVDLVHANVPEHDFAGVSQGWELYYWAPWRTYLQESRREA
jgi:uncharacterized protein YndB with AHSA1/START domain